MRPSGPGAWHPLLVPSWVPFPVCSCGLGVLRARLVCDAPGYCLRFFVDDGDQGIMYGYGGQHVALDGDTFGKVLTDARNEVLSSADAGL